MKISPIVIKAVQTGSIAQVLGSAISLEELHVEIFGMRWAGVLLKEKFWEVKVAPIAH